MSETTSRIGCKSDAYLPTTRLFSLPTPFLGDVLSLECLISSYEFTEEEVLSPCLRYYVYGCVEPEPTPGSFLLEGFYY